MSIAEIKANLEVLQKYFEDKIPETQDSSEWYEYDTAIYTIKQTIIKLELLESFSYLTRVIIRATDD